jgi:hypothetical protein
MMVDLARVEDGLAHDGIVGLPGALTPEWADRLHQDCLDLHDAASSYPTGRISRGRNRWYFAHPWLTAICERILGPAYQVAEVACDVSFSGSTYQPWHRDFRKHVGMRSDGSLCALAFNEPTVDVTDQMGPFEIVRGTQRDGIATDNEMFPDAEGRRHYENDQRRTLMRPRRGAMSVRTPLAIHRGTPNVSAHVRPMMVVTAYAGDVDLLTGHDVLAATHGFLDRLPPQVRDHLHCAAVDELLPIDQGHDIEGLVMGSE